MTRAAGRDRLRERLLFASLAHVPFDGWTRTALAAAARDLKVEPVAADNAFPGGAAELVEFFNRLADRRMLEALEGRDPYRSLVLLAHQPRGVDQAVRSGVELQLSGHTHGGQLFPWTLVVGAVYPYCKGLYRHREADREGQVYVSCGTGYWGPPMRLGAPPEVTKIVLTGV